MIKEEISGLSSNKANCKADFDFIWKRKFHLRSIEDSINGQSL